MWSKRLKLDPKQNLPRMLNCDPIRTKERIETVLLQFKESNTLQFPLYRPIP
jgi:hypothetical protein